MSIIEAAVGWLAPPLCVGCGLEGNALCPACSLAEITPFGARCWRCGALSEHSLTCDRCKRTGAPRHLWISTDYEGAAKELVRLFKFGHLRAASAPIAKLMAGTLRDYSTEEISQSDYLLVPIPTATSRIRERGFGHSELLARELSEILQLESSNVLERLGQQRQVGSRREARRSQAEGNYYLRRPSRINGRDILLVDDVITTGATLIAATRILRQAGARRVNALVFAKRL
jgi:ComF family protein